MPSTIADKPAETTPAETKPQLAPELRDLSRIVIDALDFKPPRYVEAVMGRWWTWLPPHRDLSEFRIVSPWRLWRSLKYIFKVTIPSLLYRKRSESSSKLFLNPPRVLQQGDPEGRHDSFPEEAWFYINGIVANETLARTQAECLARIFHRPITILFNNSDSAGVDVVESVMGKGWGIMSWPAREAYRVLHETLEDAAIRRVVVVAYSQGTIIAANVLRALGNPEYKAELFAPEAAAGPTGPVPELSSPELLARLELYAFGNCADTLLHDPEMRSRGLDVPWIESFSNEYDLFARMGVLAPRKERNGIEIDGSSYVHRGMLGHQLNEQYLFEIGDCLQAGRDAPYVPVEGSPERPRLYSYFAGRAPDPY